MERTKTVSCIEQLFLGIRRYVRSAVPIFNFIPTITLTAVPQIPAGYLADKYGSKYILMCTTLLSGIATILSPLSASLYGWQGLCILRVIVGFSQGFLFPSIFSMVSNWSHEKERAELGSYCVLGSDVGTILMISVSGFIAESSLGWPSIFYIPGFATIAWAVIWFIFANNSPAENRNISKIERNFIEQSKVEKANNLTIPWLEILRSIPVFAFIVTSSVQNWGYSIMLLKLPAYMKNVLNFDIKEVSEIYCLVPNKIQLEFY